MLNGQPKRRPEIQALYVSALPLPTCAATSLPTHVLRMVDLPHFQLGRTKSPHPRHGGHTIPAIYPASLAVCFLAETRRWKAAGSSTLTTSAAAASISWYG